MASLHEIIVDELDEEAEPKGCQVASDHSSHRCDTQLDLLDDDPIIYNR